jgi:hypothetical protein
MIDWLIHSFIFHKSIQVANMGLGILS